MPRMSLRYGAEESWEDRLRIVVDLMRETSRMTDPSELVRSYRDKIREFSRFEAFISLSRRGLDKPHVMITRNTEDKLEMDPWENRAKLPLFDRGILSDLIYAGEARIIDDLRVDKSDPAYPYLGKFRSAIVTPVFDGGEVLNMNLVLSSEPERFDPEHFPEQVWTTNLFGRTTGMLVLQRELNKAYKALDRELGVIAQMQRSLLPKEFPAISTIDLAAHYETSARAGGDYYDIFDLGEGRWGIFVADVSGHGTPAAVLMAITHSLAHTFHSVIGRGPCAEDGERYPAVFFEYLNKSLESRYTSSSAAFVTAFFGIYDEHERTLVSANAGHPPPRVKRCSDGSTIVLDGGEAPVRGSATEPRDLPLGIIPETRYGLQTAQLEPGDQLVLYTDGITEARGAGGELFGTRRLDRAIENCGVSASGLIATILEEVATFTGGAPADDDRTVLVGKVR